MTEYPEACEEHHVHPQLLEHVRMDILVDAHFACQILQPVTPCTGVDEAAVSRCIHPYPLLPGESPTRS